MGDNLVHSIILKSVFVAILSMAALGRQEGQSIGNSRLAETASIDGPSGIAIDESGNLYIVERKGFRIRKVDAKTGTITTIAGNGNQCCFDDGKPATLTSLAFPIAIAVDRNRNLYISDNAGRIRRVDGKTGIMTAVVRQTWARRGPDPSDAPAFPERDEIEGLAVRTIDSETSIYAIGQNEKIYRMRAGVLSILELSEPSGHSAGDFGLPQFNSPGGLAVDSVGNLFVADYGNCRIRRVDVKSGTVSTVLGNGTCTAVGDGGPATLATANHPYAVAVDADENVYFTDQSSCVRRIDRGGTVRKVPGTCEIKDGRTGPPSGLATDKQGNLYFTLFGSNIVRTVDVVTGDVKTVAGSGSPDRPGRSICNGDDGQRP